MKQAIDYVVPMVFSDDPLWQEDFKKHVLPYMEEPAFWSSWTKGRWLITYLKKYLPWVRDIWLTLRKMGRLFTKKHMRRNFEKSPNKYMDTYFSWRSWGTERLLIQLVRKNLPWVRNVYVLLARDSQRQDWMDDEDVTIVYHKDFIPEKYLPTFNSNTIEMFLHKIPGLSEYFIYGNDDMFPLTPMQETDFFEDGKPCQHMNEADWPSDQGVFLKKTKNAQCFVAALCGKGEPKKWLKNGHSLAPIKKSTCENLWKKGRKEIEASISTIRNEKSLSQYIYSWWQHYSGDYIDKKFPRPFIKSSEFSPEKLSATITKKDGVLCINDWGGSEEEFKLLAEAAKEALVSIVNREISN